MPGLRFYEVLELPLSASELDIKKAYRRLALKWHPDKNPQNKEVADRNFKAISEAYEVLSDKDKRKIYDRYGEQGLADNAATSQNGYGQYPGGVPADFVFPGFVFRSPFDVFRDFFGGGDPFQELFGDPFADMMNLHRNVEHIFSGGTAMSVAPNGALLAFPSLNLMSTGGFVHAGPMFATAAFPGFGHQGMLPNGHNFCSTANFLSFPQSLSLTMNGQSAAMGGGGGAGLRSVSSVTKFVNGRPVVEKRIVENGSETVELYDNGNLVSKTVDGVIYID